MHIHTNNVDSLTSKGAPRTCAINKIHYDTRFLAISKYAHTYNIYTAPLETQTLLFFCFFVGSPCRPPPVLTKGPQQWAGSYKKGEAMHVYIMPAPSDTDNYI